MEKDYLLHKYLNGEASESEISVLKNDPEYSEFLLIADATSEFETPEFDREKILDRIRDNRGSSTPVRRLSLMQKVLRVAAAVAVLAAGYFFLQNSNSSFETGIAEVESISLPDGSEVELNAMSSINYIKSDWEDERKLNLNGEAFFKVTKGNRFAVQTEQGVVSVLGTQFNVYSRDTIFNVKCYEGLVSVAFGDTLVKLPAGNKLKIENGKLVVHTPTNQKGPSWLNNESSFENASLATVFNELQNQYPISLSAPAGLKNKRFTGSFAHGDLEMALRSICEPMRLKYRIEDEKVFISSQ